MAVKKPVPEPQAEDAEPLCPEHFPDGWGHERLADFASVGCEHGQWNRPPDGHDGDDES